MGGLRLEHAISVMSRTEQRLTPDVVQAVSFRSAHLGRRGFDEEHVRAFCHQVQAELVRLLNERTALQEEVNRLRRHILGHPAEDDGFGYSRADAHLQAVSILSRAQQTADHYVAEAQEYSRHLAQDAQRRRDDMLAEARAHANRVIDEAHNQADQAAPVAGAGLPADGPDVEADLECVRSFNDVDRAHLRDYLGALMRGANQSEQADVEAELERVRGFNDVDRAQLRDYLGALMRGVDQLEQAAATTRIDLPRQPGPSQ
jgi:cell division septum initiation protein DivIVA